MRMYQMEMGAAYLEGGAVVNVLSGSSRTDRSNRDCGCHRERQGR